MLTDEAELAGFEVKDNEAGTVALIAVAFHRAEGHIASVGREGGIVVVAGKGYPAGRGGL